MKFFDLKYNNSLRNNLKILIMKIYQQNLRFK